MIYKINGLKIVIRPEVITEINRYYHNNFNYEVGGILFGKFSRENKVIEIMEVCQVKSSFFSKILYKRDVKKAQRIIDKRWYETNGVLNYVGEWHTHPGMQAVPSVVDKNSLREIMMMVQDVLPGIVLLIAGKEDKINLVVQRENKTEMQLLYEDERGRDLYCIHIQ